MCSDLMRKNLPLAVSGSITALLVSCGTSTGVVDETQDNGTSPIGPVWAIFDAPPSGRANQSVIVDGEFVGTDEIHFARGANADGLHHEQYYAPGGVPPEPQPTPVEDDDVYRHSTWGAFGTDRAAHNGDYLLPTDLARWPDFTADIGFVRLEATETDLFLQVRFVSFPAPDAQIATLTITSNSDNPEVADWPRNAGIRSNHSHALTIWGLSENTGGGELAIAVNAAVADLQSIGGEVRITDHAFEARVPLASLPAGPWQLGVGTGLADPDDPTQYWTVPAGAPTESMPGTDASTAPGSNVWDLAFTPHDPNFHDDHIQGDLLLNGDVSAATTFVDLAALQTRASVPAPAITGRITHTYESEFDFGDGISRGSPGTPPVPAAPVPNNVRPRDTAVNYEYTGKLQPFFAYIPQDYPNTDHDWPLVLYFHGLNNYIWEPFGLTLGLEDQLEARGYLFASLLGRGDISFEGRGELDPLEVISHMQARYRIDPNRIYIVGHSHGGGGVLNVSRRNPDLFAAVVSAQITEASAQPENFVHVPTIHIAGQQDPIDNGTSARARYNALSSLGYDSQLLIYQAKTHENSSIHDALVEIFDLYDRSTQDPNPANVVFTRGGGDFDESLGLLHDGAYWVSEMVAADPSQDMSIRATSFAIAHLPLDPNAATTIADQPVDTAGPSGRSLATLSQTMPGFGAMTDAANRASIVASNLVATTLDVQRMALDFTLQLQFDLSLANDLALTFLNITGNSINWRILDSNGTEIVAGSSAVVQDRATIPVPQAATQVTITAQ